MRRVIEVVGALALLGGIAGFVHTAIRGGSPLHARELALAVSSVLAFVGPVALVSGARSVGATIPLSIIGLVALLGVMFLTIHLVDNDHDEAVRTALQHLINGAHFPLFAFAGGIFLRTYVLGARFTCPHDQRVIRPWHRGAGHCVAKECPHQGRLFHPECLRRVGEWELTGSEPDDLTRLVERSFGRIPQQPKAGPPGAKTFPVCSECMRRLSRAALHELILHSAFMERLDVVTKQVVTCEKCHQTAARNPGDETRLKFEGPDGLMYEPRAFQLGPLVRCPQCGRRHHLFCWLANGGCMGGGVHIENTADSCSMQRQNPQVPVFFTRGWQRLCADHAAAAGWTVAGLSHTPIHLPIP